MRCYNQRCRGPKNSPNIGTFLLTIFSALTSLRRNTDRDDGLHLVHHSTETAILYLFIYLLCHDHLINATGSQKISCLSSWPLSGF